MTPLQHMLYHLRASGPATHLDIAGYLFHQSADVTSSNMNQVTETAVKYALDSYLIVIYGESEPEAFTSFDITAAGVAYLERHAL